MTRKILINGRREEELRVAIVDNQTLEDFEIETKLGGLLRNNIYRGVVSNIAPSLNAAFVDFGEAKNGFLSLNDVVESSYHKSAKEGSYRISDVLHQGQQIIVQVIKDASGSKGAQVTTNISLAGRYLVLRPRDAKSGVSRKVDDDARADLTQKVRSLDLPDGYGCIVRTNATNQPRAILLRDAKVLVQLWHKIEAEFARGSGPQLLYNDQDIVVQAMRDYFDSTIAEVIIDHKPSYVRALSYVAATMAGSESKIKFYEDRTPLFARYQIESQINQIYAREVPLPSGGFIVIDPTEALTAIDVNSARSTKRETQDLTAYHTNLEAASEIGRQLRMRDIGGLIVIDFIDMKSGKHQRDVERAMRNAMQLDKARNKIERISANGLLEINRQRISQALSQRTHLTCPTCAGRGFVPSVEAIGLAIMREIEGRAVLGTIGGVSISLHPEIAQTLQNARRHDIVQLEEEYDIHIDIIASRDLQRGEEKIEWISRETTQAQQSRNKNGQTPSVDAASIGDAADAYQAHDVRIDDTYRPNDYEEFSSQEARQKRAIKRSRNLLARTAGDRDGTDVLKGHDVEAAAPKAAHKKSELQAEQEGIYHAVAFACLASMLRHMRVHLDKENDTDSRSNRRPSFKSRRNGKKEAHGIAGDIRLFSQDIVKAVAFFVSGEVFDGYSEVLGERIPEAIDWLMTRANSSPAVSLAEYEALRSNIPSRHARIRLEALIDSRGERSSRDELAMSLCEDRDAVFDDMSRLSTDKRLSVYKLDALDARIEARIQRIFGAKVAPQTFDTSDVDAEDSQAAHVESAVAEKPAPSRERSRTRNVREDDVQQEASNRKPRVRTRRRPGVDADQDLDLAGFNQDGVIVEVDVEVAPMGSVELWTDTRDLSADEKLAIAQDITQELPAVASRSNVRRPRRTRPRINEGHDNVATEQVETPVVQVEAARDERRSRSAEAPRQERQRQVHEAPRDERQIDTQSDRQSAPQAEQKCQDEHVEDQNTRRTRRTRRQPLGVAASTRQEQTESKPVALKVTEDVSSHDEADRGSRSRRRPATDRVHDVEKSVTEAAEVSSTFEAVPEVSKTKSTAPALVTSKPTRLEHDADEQPQTRRVRKTTVRTSRASQQEQVIEVPHRVAPVDVQVAEKVQHVMPDAQDEPNDRGRTRRPRRVVPASKEVQELQPKVSEPIAEEQKRTRRPRRVVPASKEVQELQPKVSEPIAEKQERTRRPRRVVPASKEVQELQPKVSEPIVEEQKRTRRPLEAVVEEQASQPQATEQSAKEQSRSRERRTRRPRPGQV